MECIPKNKFLKSFFSSYPKELEAKITKYVLILGVDYLHRLYPENKYVSQSVLKQITRKITKSSDSNNTIKSELECIKNEINKLAERFHENMFQEQADKQAKPTRNQKKTPLDKKPPNTLTAIPTDKREGVAVAIIQQKKDRAPNLHVSENVMAVLHSEDENLKLPLKGENDRVRTTKDRKSKISITPKVTQMPFTVLERASQPLTSVRRHHLDDEEMKEVFSAQQNLSESPSPRIVPSQHKIKDGDTPYKEAPQAIRSSQSPKPGKVPSSLDLPKIPKENSKTAKSAQLKNHQQQTLSHQQQTHSHQQQTHSSQQQAHSHRQQIPSHPQQISRVTTSNKNPSVQGQNLTDRGMVRKSLDKENNLSLYNLSKPTTRRDSSDRDRKSKGERINSQTAQPNANSLKVKKRKPGKIQSKKTLGKNKTSIATEPGSSAKKTLPTYLRNVQSKIKDQVDYHKNLRKMHKMNTNTEGTEGTEGTEESEGTPEENYEKKPVYYMGSRTRTVESDIDESDFEAHKINKTTDLALSNHYNDNSHNNYQYASVESNQNTHHGSKWGQRGSESMANNENLTTDDRTTATYPERSVVYYENMKLEQAPKESDNLSESEFSQFKGNYEQFQQVFNGGVEENEFGRDRDFRHTGQSEFNDIRHDDDNLNSNRGEYREYPGAPNTNRKPGPNSNAFQAHQNSSESSSRILQNKSHISLNRSHVSSNQRLKTSPTEGENYDFSEPQVYPDITHNIYEDETESESEEDFREEDSEDIKPYMFNGEKISFSEYAKTRSIRFPKAYEEDEEPNGVNNQNSSRIGQNMLEIANSFLNSPLIRQLSQNNNSMSREKEEGKISFNGANTMHGVSFTKGRSKKRNFTMNSSNIMDEGVKDPQRRDKHHHSRERRNNTAICYKEFNDKVNPQKQHLHAPTSMNLDNSIINKSQKISAKERSFLKHQSNRKKATAEKENDISVSSSNFSVFSPREEMKGFFQQEYFDKQIDKAMGAGLGRPMSVRDRMSSENSSNISFSGVSGAAGDLFPHSRREVFEENFV